MCKALLIIVYTYYQLYIERLTAQSMNVILFVFQQAIHGTLREKKLTNHENTLLLPSPVAEVIMIEVVVVISSFPLL